MKEDNEKETENANEKKRENKLTEGREDKGKEVVGG